MTPPVSIVLPTLNEHVFIRDCLDSLLAQDYSSIDEFLVEANHRGEYRSIWR